MIDIVTAVAATYIVKKFFKTNVTMANFSLEDEDYARIHTFFRYIFYFLLDLQFTEDSANLKIVLYDSKYYYVDNLNINLLTSKLYQFIRLFTKAVLRFLN